jgi:long-subunit fatty acid transport protein
MPQGEWMNQRTGRSWLGISLLLGATTLATLPGRAHAGGFEEPGLGVEAMGRGGAFAAKADDGTALEYNIAGFARQRGTNLTIEGRLSLANDTFTRFGAYPTITGTPQSGKAYPTVKDTNGVSAAPLVAISSDFGYFERWTFAVGLTTPAVSDGDRQYPKTVNGTWPSPQRYDVIGANLLVVYPMLAAAVRATKWLDLGVAVQMAYGHFDLNNDASADLGPAYCGTTKENPNCDINLRLKTSGFTATGVFGAMVHPIEGLHLAVNLRGPMGIPSTGTAVGTLSPNFPIAIPLDPGSAANPAPVKLPFHLPWVLRFGARYAFMKGNFERGDIEIDGTYETWHEAQGTGDDVDFTKGFGPLSANTKIKLVHHYKDTGSVRIGGAWNFKFSNDSVLTPRVGWFYDSSATSNQWTRNDFDTLAKIGICLGLGYKIRGVTMNVAYNYITSPTREVAAGHQQLVNGLNGTLSQANGDPTAVINNGKYTASDHVILFGLVFRFDEVLKKNRVLVYN